jgi:hypothetical protein
VATVEARTDPETAVAAEVRPRRWWRRHRILTGITAVIAACVVVAAPSLVPALTHPGTDSVAARFAEWARTHGFSSIVDLAERISYDLHPPKVGGTPSAGIPGGAAPVPPAQRAADPRALPLPAPLKPVASTPLPNEGAWHVAATVRGMPALATAYLRPDKVHTSYVSGVVWMNAHLLTFALHPGYEDPGSTGWAQPDTIPNSVRRGLLAAFNSGFRLNASRGGYFAYGRTATSLRVGAASMVIYKDGSATVGQWGRDVSMTPNVAAVRQNLDLIVDGGHDVPGLQQNVQARWGFTLGNAYYVWRSGIGVRPDGSLVYVAGNALSALTLARLLVHAGCVRAMELDINPQWTNFTLFNGAGHPGAPMPHRLLPDMQQPSDRYFQPVSRDFFTVYRRGGA